MQKNVVLYAFPWYQPQLEPRKQFGKYIVTGLVHMYKWKKRQWEGKRGKEERREKGREGGRGDIPPSAMVSLCSR